MISNIYLQFPSLPAMRTVRVSLIVFSLFALYYYASKHHKWLIAALMTTFIDNITTGVQKKREEKRENVTNVTQTACWLSDRRALNVGPFQSL